MLDHISAAAVQGALVFAGGARPMRLVAAASGTAPIALKGYAFDVDANVRVHVNDRPRLERLCRYLLRPPIANDRITQRADGRFVRPPIAASASADSPDVDAPCLPCGRQRTSWAKLLMRVFTVDVLACPRCKTGRLQRIAFITQPSAIRAILASVGLATAPPERRPALRNTGDEIWG